MQEVPCSDFITTVYLPWYNSSQFEEPLDDNMMFPSATTHHQCNMKTIYHEMQMIISVIIQYAIAMVRASL